VRVPYSQGMVYPFGNTPRTASGQAAAWSVRIGRGTPRRALSSALAFVLVVVALHAPATAGEFHGRVVGVADGDTITVLHNGRAEVVRLHGIDAPEKGQPFGERAKQFTASLAFGQTVVVQVRDRDRYRRTVADVVLPDGRSLNQALVRAGYAWWFRRYSADHRLAAAEIEARTAHVGLWRDPDPVPPWEWRRNRRQVTLQPTRVGEPPP
jgi:micrococcal nuclease